MAGRLEPIAALSFDLGARVLCAPGLLRQAGDLLRDLGIERVFLVCDPGVQKAGHLAVLLSACQAARVACTVFLEVQAEPDEPAVERCFAAFTRSDAQAVFVLGGGSAIDTAKAALLLASGGGRVRDYWGHNKARALCLPLVVAPTTAGTGSEVQSYALISHADTHAKMACGDRRVRPRLVLLDAELCLSLPRAVSAQTGLDALVHAVESAVSTAGNALSRSYAATALRWILGALPRVLTKPQDLAAREQMLLGACFAGAAIEASMLGAAHAMANPLSARAALPHGSAVGLLLRYVLPYNAADPATRARYASLARASLLAGPLSGDDEAYEALAARIDTMAQLAELPADLRGFGFVPAQVSELARDAAAQWTARFNPRPVSEEDFQVLYARAMGM